MKERNIIFKDLMNINIVSLISGTTKEFEDISIGVYDFVLNDIGERRDSVAIFLLTSAHNNSFCEKDVVEFKEKLKSKYADKKIILLYTNNFKDMNKLNSILNDIDFLASVNTNFLSFLNILEDIKTEKYHTVVHATLVSIYGEGVLFKGAAGIGKSELAVSLINRGHFLVADDSVNIFYDHGSLRGLPSKKVDGFLEVRGIGIVNIKKTFGIQSFTPSHKVDLIIELESYDRIKANQHRLVNKVGFEDVLGINIPKVKIYISPGKSLVDLVEVATINEKYRKYDDYNSTEDFLANLKK